MAGEPAYVTSLEEVAWGLVLIAVTIVMHGIGTTLALTVTRGLLNPTQSTRVFLNLARVIGLAQLLVVLHLLEVAVWAIFCFWKECFSTLSLNYYVSLMNYTTLGSEYSLPTRWRLLEGMIAICGLLTFAWTTSVMMGVIQQLQDRRMSRHQIVHASDDASAKGGER